MIGLKIGFLFSMKVLFLGAGYCSQHIIKLLDSSIDIYCTHRTKETVKKKTLDDIRDIKRLEFSKFLKNKSLLCTFTHILISIPPDDNGDLVLNKIKENLNEMKNLVWFGYFSTTGVYGDHNGEWVDEETELKTLNLRSVNRIKAENQYLELYKESKIPIHIFRLPGIYGPGRSIFDRLKNKDFRIVIKKNHFFSRIHVDDIANAIYLSMLSPTPGEIYNIVDDFPCPSDEVSVYACKLSDIKEPLKVNYNDNYVSDFTKSFYNENRKVSNLKIKKKLNWKPKYPNFKKGLESILNISQIKIDK